jgi:CBS domain-containing protein
MNARDVMTKAVVSVHPDTPVREIARLLLDKGISAVPVVDNNATPIGIVSEGDLIRRDQAAREARRKWWLEILAEGEQLSPEFLAWLNSQKRAARAIMSAPVITVSEDTEVDEIARLLVAHQIKRVPVVRDGRLVGIVAREDLLRTLLLSNSDRWRPKSRL